jgi:hypothetical protein
MPIDPDAKLDTRPFFIERTQHRAAERGQAAECFFLKGVLRRHEPPPPGVPDDELPA